MVGWKVLARGRSLFSCWLLGDLEQVAQTRNAQPSLLKPMGNLMLKGALGFQRWIMGQGSVTKEATYEDSSN